MTPPDNTERGTERTSSGSLDESSSTAQGSAQDDAESSADQDTTTYLPKYSEQLSADERGEADLYSASAGTQEARGDQKFLTGELPIVTGAAASRVYGNSDSRSVNSSADSDSGDNGTTKGQDDVSVASADTNDTSAPTALRRPGRGPRRASLQVKRFDPWSVLKLSLVLGVVMFFVWLITVGLLYTVLEGMGVWDKLNGTYTSLVSGEGADADTDPLISAGPVFGVAAILGMINIVLMSALATVSAFIYNVAADLAGGLEVTLSERE